MKVNILVIIIMVIQKQARACGVISIIDLVKAFVQSESKRKSIFFFFFRNCVIFVLYLQACVLVSNP